MDPGKTLAQWVSAQEQESYLSHMKQVIKNILQTTVPFLICRCNNFLFLNFIYIILHNWHFRKLKTNQLLSKKKKKYITHAFYYTWCNWYLIHLADRSLSFLWILSHSVDWDFTFSAVHVWLRSKFIQIVEVGYTKIQSKVKINGLLI